MLSRIVASILFVAATGSAAVTLTAREGLEQNRGQFPANILYATRSGFYLTRDALVLSPSQTAMQFEGSRPDSQVSPSDPLSYKVNVYSGADSKQWLTGISKFGKVTYKGVYTGVDVEFSLEAFTTFRFTLAPGVSPSAIRLHYQGPQVTLSPFNPSGLIIWEATSRFGQNSTAYQSTSTGRVAVGVTYTSPADNTFSFDLGAHDTTLPVVIETTLPFGGSGYSWTPTVISRSGAFYAIGVAKALVTASVATDTTTEPVNEVCGIGTMNYLIVCDDAALARFNPTGELAYVTYLRGAREDNPQTIAVDKQDGVYVSGITNSLDFPTTSGASQRTYAGPAQTFIHGYLSTWSSDAFVAKIDGKTGELVYSTYLGGSDSDQAPRIFVDDAGDAFVAGPSNASLPVTAGALQSTPCVVDPPPGSAQPSTLCGLGYLARINPTGGLTWLTQLPPEPTAITVDGGGNTYLGGYSRKNGNSFLARLNPTGSALVYSATHSGNGVDSIAPDSQGNVWFSVGLSPSVSTTWIDDYYHGTLVKLSSNGGSVLYETPFIGGKLAVDASDNLSIYTQGYGSGIVRTPGGLLTSVCGDVTVSKLAADGRVLMNRPLAVSTVIGFTPDANVLTANSGRLDTATLAAIAEPDAACMVNSAGLSGPASFAPGELVTVLGRGIGPKTGATAKLDAAGHLPTSLEGVQVLFNGAPVPILYADASQVNAIAPFSLQPGAPVEIQVRYQNAVTSVLRPVVEAAVPALFSLDSSGTGRALVFNQDGTLNSSTNPAKLGSIVTLFATGTGITNPASVEGAVATSIEARPAIIPTIALASASVLETIYAGPSPGSLTSVTQLNLRLPAVLTTEARDLPIEAVYQQRSLQRLIISVTP